MNIAIVSQNNNFIWQVEETLKKLGTVRRWLVLNPVEDPSGTVNFVTLGKVCQWADLIWMEFAQTPIEYVVNLFPSKHIIVRLMRIEMYNETLYDLNWNAVDLLIFSANHVKQRFYEKLEARNNVRNLLVNRPIRSEVISGNLWPPQFTFVERRFDRPYRMACAGHLVPKKRVYTLVQMFAELPPYFTLDIAGGLGMPGYGNPEYPQNIKDLIEELGLQGRVNLVGPIPYESMPEFYQEHDIIVSNSNEEGDALNVSEAMACGCYPLINCWRGARQHYGFGPVFRTVGEFVFQVKEWIDLSVEDKLAASRRARKHAEEFRLGGPWNEKLEVLTRNVIAFDKMATYYDHTCEEDVYQANNERVTRTISWLKGLLKPGMRVLSLGCGIGVIEEALAQSEIEVVGVDISTAKINEAQKRTKGKPNLKFITADVLHESILVLHMSEQQPQITPFTIMAPSFDAVLMIDFIEHIRLEEQHLVFEKFKYWAKPIDARVIINMPTPTSPRGGRCPQPIDEAVYPEDLIRRLAEYGFPRVIQKGPWLGDIYYRLVVGR